MAYYLIRYSHGDDKTYVYPEALRGVHGNYLYTAIPNKR